ncbi:MAG: diguanylate cyclase [Oscillospiraceae bacterium]|nr:diguanylate cyclase [Oscillospiraceae bacterium]
MKPIVQRIILSLLLLGTVVGMLVQTRAAYSSVLVAASFLLSLCAFYMYANWAGKQKADALSALHDYTDKLNKTLEKIMQSPEFSGGALKDFASIAAPGACKALNISRVGIWIFDEGNTALKSISCFDTAAGLFIQGDFPLEGNEKYHSALLSSRLVVLNSPGELADIMVGQDPGLCALLDAPVRSGGRLVGVICCEQMTSPDYPDGRVWTAEEQSFASSLADLMALAVANDERRIFARRIEAMTNNFPGVIYQCLYDPPEYTFTYVSEGCLELTGYTQDELTGNSAVKFFDIVHPDDVALLEDTADETEPGAPFEASFRIITKSGEEKWLWERSKAVELTTDGQPCIIEGFYTEITEQRRLEAAELSNLMLDSSPLCSQIWDKNLRTIDCNIAAVNLYGFKDKREYVERFSRDCSPPLQPDGQRSGEKGRALVEQAFREGYCNFHWIHRVPGDDTPMPAEVTLVRVSYKGDYVVVGYTKDLREVARLEAEAEKIYYDALTGIYNRRYFDEQLERAMKSLSRSGGLLTVMMIDIDYFKDYNDIYGHSAGDSCLKTVAEILCESVTRTDDFTARYGGEEFAVVLPNTGEYGARYVAARLLQKVRDLKIPHEKSAAESYVTISIGAMTGKPKYTQSPYDYVKQADEMLYKSKEDGRNRYSYISEI